MEPEVWVGIAAVFVSGGAIGAAGTLLAQWIVRKVAGDTPGGAGSVGLPDREAELLRMEVADLSRQVQNMDARLEFQEQLVGGSLDTTAPPPRLERPADASPQGEDKPDA